MSRPTVGKLLADKSIAGQSPLRRWLHQHRAEFAPVIAGQDRPSWSALAQLARDNGITDKNGCAPDRHAVRKAWMDLDKRASRLPLRPTVVTPIAVSVTLPMPPADSIPTTNHGDTPSPMTERPRHTFAVAKFKFRE